jgi:hypothetical protein
MARVGFMIVIVIAIVTRDVVLIDRDASVIGEATRLRLRAVL